MMSAIFSGLATPVIRYTVIGLSILAFIAWQRIDAAKDATVRAELKFERLAQEAVQTERERLERVNRDILQDAAERADKARDAATATQEKADALVAQLDAANARCAVPPDILRQLHDIE